MGDQTPQLLEENIRRTLSDMNLNSIFSNLAPRIMERKTKINKWDLIELNSVCTAEETKPNKKTAHRMGRNDCK